MKKYLTFLIAMIMALGTLTALDVLGTNLLSMSGIGRHVGSKTYQIMRIYLDVPVFFFCTVIAQFLYRSSPLFLSTSFALLKACMLLLSVPFMVYCSHFWIESGICLVAGIAGALLAQSMLNREHREKTVHPVWASIVAFSTIILAWALTFPTLNRLDRQLP